MNKSIAFEGLLLGMLIEWSLVSTQTSRKLHLVKQHSSHQHAGRNMHMEQAPQIWISSHLNETIVHPGSHKGNLRSGVIFFGFSSLQGKTFLRAPLL